MTPLLAVVLVLTVYRLTRLIAVDTLPPVLHAREWVLSRWPADDTVFTSEAVTYSAGTWQTEAGRDVFQLDADTFGASEPHWIGDLITCPWCASVWIAALTVPVFWLFPDVMIWVGIVPAASAVSGLLSGVE